MEGGKVLSDAEKQALMQGGEQGQVEEKPTNEPVKKEETEVVEEKVEEKPTEFDYSAFNKRFGREVNDEESLKSLFEKADNYEATKKSHDETTKLLTEYKGLAEKLDPMAYFANEDEYVRQQFLKNKAGELGDDAIKALSVMSPSRVKELSNVEAIKLNLMVDKGLDGKEADAYMSKHYEVEDFNDEDLDAGVTATFKVDGKDAKDSLGKLYDGIDIPTKTDYETARTQLKESWESPVSELVKGIDKIQLEEGLDFVVTDAMKEGLEQSVTDYVMSNQLKPSEEAGAQIAGMLREQLVIQNLDKVIKSVRADLEESFKAENRAKIHNDKPLDSSNRSENQNEDNDSKMSRIL